MAFVYRYSHPRSEAVVYIGKTSGDGIDSLAGRISAHKKEAKFIIGAPRGGWKIEYVEGLTPADADILETALIAECPYVPRLNKGKTNWGKSTFIDVSNLSWNPWPPASSYAPKPVIDRWYGGSPDAVYTCECCGISQQIGESLMPGHIHVTIKNQRHLFTGGIWLCDDCAVILGEYIAGLIDGLKGGLSA